MEIFNGSEAKSPGVVGAVKRTLHLPVSDSNTGSLVSFARTGIAAHWNPSVYQNILELAEAGVRRSGPLRVPEWCLSRL
jgi:hypothetical protein